MFSEQSKTNTESSMICSWLIRNRRTTRFVIITIVAISVLATLWKPPKLFNFVYGDVPTVQDKLSSLKTSAVAKSELLDIQKDVKSSQGHPMVNQMMENAVFNGESSNEESTTYFRTARTPIPLTLESTTSDVNASHLHNNNKQQGYVVNNDLHTYLARNRETKPTNYQSSKTSDHHSVRSTRPNADLAKKVTHIGFLKVHKAGSTTLQNMFFRFGIKNHLTFVLPTGPNEIHNYGKGGILPIRRDSHYDILACHTIFSQSRFESVLPVDTLNVAIVREPLERMISAAYYHRDVFKKLYLTKVPRKAYIQNIINYPNKYDRATFSRTRNQMGWDFGFSARLTENSKHTITNHLNHLKEQFKLVMVMERFDESVVLMRRMLNWDLQDIIYLKSNAHAYNNVTLNSTELSKFKSTCFLDYALYDTFAPIFNDKVKEEGDGFQDEVLYFGTIISKVSTFCRNSTAMVTKEAFIVTETKWNKQFYVSVEDCTLMKTPEVDFQKMMKTRHQAMNR